MADTIKKIDYAAFCECENLKDIKLPNQLEEIESSAFARCTNLTEIFIPKSVKSISSSAFSECINLKTIIIEEGSTLEIPSNKWGATNATISIEKKQ